MCMSRSLSLWLKMRVCVCVCVCVCVWAEIQPIWFQRVFMFLVLCSMLLCFVFLSLCTRSHHHGNWKVVHWLALNSFSSRACCYCPKKKTCHLQATWSVFMSSCSHVIDILLPWEMYRKLSVYADVRYLAEGILVLLEMFTIYACLYTC